MLIIGACIVILLLGAVMTGIQSFRSDEYTELHNVTTASANSSSITLTQDLFDGETAYVTLSSNVTGDAPRPSSYTAATNALLVVGLQPSTTRQLTVTYDYSRLSSYWGADLGARAWPLFLILGVIGVIAGAVYAAARRE